mgnify:CR=1 FL=1
MLKEVIYQAVDYLGIGRVRPFLDAANEILTSRGVKLPLEGQATTTMEDRLEKGVQAQADIFGDHMKEAWKAGHINRWLADNCFGDYYTRTGLDDAQREMITLCFLAAQAGASRSWSATRRRTCAWATTARSSSRWCPSACPTSATRAA